LGTLKEGKNKRVSGQMKRGRPKKSWDEVMKEDIKKRSLRINDAQDRDKWRRCCRRVVDPGLQERRPCHQGRMEKSIQIANWENILIKILFNFVVVKSARIYPYKSVPS